MVFANNILEKRRTLNEWHTSAFQFLSRSIVRVRFKMFAAYSPCTAKLVRIPADSR